MKFIAEKNAPNIPLELIEAQENDDLVFFCGAGISYPAGLPDFPDLVTKVYKGLAQEKSRLEAQAIEDWLFDRALGLLEQRINGCEIGDENLVKKEIIKQLKIKDEADLKTHAAILELAKTKTNRYRLVTTNVDSGFTRAGDLSDKQLDAAPTLPVPKSHKWSSVVHLHGLIDEDQDPNGDHLVFTSGDFGAAYLTERWASKFVTDLFMNFTVVFVGYSINDPVIRYMTDAIAAERRFNSKRFQLPYVIADIGSDSYETAKAEWIAKGVEPVLYKADSKEHNNLHESLIAWAEHSRDGLNSKLRIVKSSARIIPKFPYKQDESIRRVIDVISEKINKNDSSIEGNFAKVFANLDNPPAPIEWLQVLNDEGLLSISKNNSEVNPVGVNSLESNLIIPNKVTLHLWRWLLKHLQTKEMVGWVIDRGADLHPDLKSSIIWELERTEIEQPYLKFWKIITSSKIKMDRISRSEIFQLLRSYNAGDYLALYEFKKKITPYYEVSKKYPSELLGGGGDSEKIPYAVDVSISLEKYEYRQIKDLKGYPYQYTSLLEVVNSALLEAMQLFEYVGQANDLYDRSSWIMVSIKEHPQNSHYKNISLLIAMCRDLWVSQYYQNPKVAISLLTAWSNYKYPVFRRLTMHAYTETDAVTADEAVSYLLDQNAKWLWSTVTTREVFRLLARFWTKISVDKANELFSFIKAGPSRDKYKATLSDEEFEYRHDRERWMILAKLESYGRTLFHDAQKLYGQLCSKYPRWRLQEDDRDEFTRWHSTGSGYDVDITQEILFSLSVQDRIKKLQKDDRYQDGCIHLFRMSGEDYSKDVITTLRSMYRRKNWDQKIWHAGLGAASESTASNWQDLSWIVLRLPEYLYKNEGHAIAWWVKNELPKKDANSQPDTRLMAIARRMLASTKDEPLDIDESVGVMNLAINAPVGMMTEAVLNRFGALNPQFNDCIPTPEPVGYFEEVLGNDAYITGQINIFEKLAYFYSIDPVWTKAKMLPLLSTEITHLSKYYWEAYLWNPRITADLAIDIKLSMLKIIDANVLKDTSLEGVANIFSYMCIEYKKILTSDEKKTALRSLGKEGLAYVADYLHRSISEVESDKINYYENRVKPFLVECWPRGIEYRSSEISSNLALMTLVDGNKFVVAMTDVESMLSRVEHHHYVMGRIEETDVPERFASSTLALMDKVFNANDKYDLDSVKSLLARLKISDPELEQDARFKQMNDVVVKNT
ncbi:MAG: SIR2 family protein [Cycloclasticus sp.]